MSESGVSLKLVHLKCTLCGQIHGVDVGLSAGWSKSFSCFSCGLVNEVLCFARFPLVVGRSVVFMFEVHSSASKAKSYKYKVIMSSANLDALLNSAGEV